MRRRIIRKVKAKRNKKIIVITLVGLLLILCVGYAAFSTNLSLTAKGNIKCDPIVVEDLKQNVVTSGDGLYKDKYTHSSRKNIYVYAGKNPNNYIEFNNEIWRIILIMGNELKIIRDQPLSIPMNFDNSNTRITNNVYCNSTNIQNNKGCNLWGSTVESYEMYASVKATAFPYRADDLTQTITGPNQISSINMYLNNEYYNEIDKNFKKYIVNKNFDYGLMPTLKDKSSYSIEDLISNSSFYFGQYLVGLPKVIDYLIASSYNGCGENYYYTSESCTKAAASQNWMYDEENSFWTINPIEYLENGGYYTFKVAAVDNITGGITQVDAYSNTPSIYVKPTLFLKSDIKLCGKGTEQNPFKLIENYNNS